MFSYKELSIQSAIPIAEIRAYLSEIGAKETADLLYKYGAIEIEITKVTNRAPEIFNIPRHDIRVKGKRADAENFLTEFRFKFLSAGG